MLKTEMSMKLQTSLKMNPDTVRWESIYFWFQTADFNLVWSRFSDHIVSESLRWFH